MSKSNFDFIRFTKLIALVLVFLVLFSDTTFAQELRERRSEKVVIIPKWETIDKNFVVINGERVEISGVVNGDVYVVSGEVTVDGVINGDFLAVAGGVDISGVVKQDVRVLAERINISGRIDKNIMVFGKDLRVSNSANLGGGVLAIVGSALIDSDVSGDIEVVAGSFTLSSKVSGDIKAYVDTLYLVEGASVDKDLIYTSNKEALIDKKASVSGQILRKQRSKVSWNQIFIYQSLTKLFQRLRTFLTILSFLSNLIIGFLFIRFFPNFLRQGVVNLKKRPWASIAVGFFSLIFTPFFIFFLFLSLVGIPLAFSLLFLYLVGLIFAKIFVAFRIGESFLSINSSKRPYLGYILGLVGLFVFLLIPIIGDITSLLVTFLGLGAGILSFSQIYKKSVKEGLF